MSKIKVAVLGVGDCCSSLVQGVSSYNNGDFVGIKFNDFGGYKPSDIQFTAAFDIDSLKVGKELSEAIFAKTNRYEKVNGVEPLGVTVQKGEVMDGLGEFLQNQIKVDKKPSVNVSEELKKSKTEIVINFVPTGAVQASKWYAEQASRRDVPSLMQLLQKLQVAKIGLLDSKRLNSLLLVTIL